MQPIGPADESTARMLDAANPLAASHEQFVSYDGLYMDGNSLGLPPKQALDALDRVTAEWQHLAIEAWTEGEQPWFSYAERLGDRLAPLVGAAPESVVVANATTINIHTLVGTFYEPAGERTKIVVDELNFPTDTYAIRSQLRLRGLDPDDHLRVVESRDGRTIETADVVDAIDETVALVFVPSVLYRSGQRLDLATIAAATERHGIPFGVDLAHSVGVVDHDLGAIDVDFAVWCHYKYCNAGPGAPAGLYVDPVHHGRLPALAGWWGHDKETQFAMRPTFTPADSAGAWQIGTPPVLSMAPLDGALDVIEAAGIEEIRATSVALTEYLIALVDALPDELGYEIGTPRDAVCRGGHVALEHDNAAQVSEALRDRGVIVDFRPPNVVRICPAPLYTSYEDVRRVVEHCREIVADGRYEEYEQPGTVS
jgi:kynureninase